MQAKTWLLLLMLLNLQACQGQSPFSPQSTGPLNNPLPSSSAGLVPTPSPIASSLTPTSTPHRTWQELEQRSIQNCAGYANLSQVQSKPVWLPDSDWLLFTDAVSHVTSYSGIQCGSASSGVSSTYTLLNLKTGQTQLLPVGRNDPAPLISASGRYLIAQNRDSAQRTRLIQITPVYQETEIQFASINTAPIAFADEQRLLTLTWVDPQYQNLDSMFINKPDDIQHLIKLRHGSALGIWLETSKRFLKSEKNYPPDPSRVNDPWQVTLLLKLDDPLTQQSRLLWQQSEPSTSSLEGLTVSPDQKYAAFWLQRTSSADKSEFHSQAILVNLDSGQAQTIFQSTAAGKPFGWSQDSQQLAFGAKGPDDSHAQIYSFKPQQSGAGAKALVKLSGRDLDSPAWSPDTQQMVVFAGSVSATTNPPSPGQQDHGLYLFELSNSSAKQLSCGSYDSRVSFQEFQQKPFAQTTTWRCAK